MTRFSVVDPGEVPSEQFQTCETAVRKLTEPLGCTELRVNQVRVEPGEVTTPHTHDGQEEVFVALTAGQIGIEGEVHEVPADGLVRVHEDTMRHLLNRTEERHVWLAFGAPPVGSVDDFGAYVVEDGGRSLAVEPNRASRVGRVHPCSRAHSARSHRRRTVGLCYVRSSAWETHSARR